MPGKRVQFDQETWNALDLLARDSIRDFQELADEAVADLLRKHSRPIDLKTALRQSVGDIEKRPAAPSVRRQNASRKAHKSEWGPSWGVQTRGLDMRAVFKRDAADGAARAEAEAVIQRRKDQLALGGDMLWSPTIRAAMLAGPHGSTCSAPAGGTSHTIDLRTIDRHPLASVGTLVLGLRCSWCLGSPVRRLTGLSRAVAGDAKAIDEAGADRVGGDREHIIKVSALALADDRVLSDRCLANRRLANRSLANHRGRRRGLAGRQISGRSSAHDSESWCRNEENLFHDCALPLDNDAHLRSNWKPLLVSFLVRLVQHGFKIHWDSRASNCATLPAFHSPTPRGAREIKIIDLGLQPWEAIELGLEVERRLRSLGFTDPTRDNLPIVLHGFRRTLVTFAQDHGYPKEVRNTAIAHTGKGSRAHRTYEGSSYLPERRKLLTEFAAFATGALIRWMVANGISQGDWARVAVDVPEITKRWVLHDLRRSVA
jgi:hypothetical protein